MLERLLNRMRPRYEKIRLGALRTKTPTDLATGLASPLMDLFRGKLPAPARVKSSRRVRGRGNARQGLSHLAARAETRVESALLSGLPPQFVMARYALALEKHFVGLEAQACEILKLGFAKAALGTLPIDVLKAHYPGFAPLAGQKVGNPSRT
jgi:hypothetical protein